MSYESDEYKKLMTVIDAALQNKTRGGVQIQTQGCDPSASVTIEAYVLEKLLKAPSEK